jgi:HrpA-like RNA helicase
LNSILFFAQLGVPCFVWPLTNPQRFPHLQNAVQTIEPLYALKKNKQQIHNLWRKASNFDVPPRGARSLLSSHSQSRSAALVHFSLALSQRAERPPPFKTAAHTGLAFENKAIYFALSRHQFAPCPTCAEKKGDRIEKKYT